MQLFPKNRKDGVFRGFQQGGLEFHADLALPYRSELQNIPMHGQFLLVQLENENEAVLGRITSFSSEGKLSYGSGEEFNIRAMLEERPVPDDLREQYLRYRVNIRVLQVHVRALASQIAACGREGRISDERSTPRTRWPQDSGRRHRSLRPGGVHLLRGVV
jgi:hypothetical protein